MSSKFTGQLYQLRSKSKLHDGAYVAVNGPWDTYGVVLSSTDQGADGYLNVVRGCQSRKGAKPVAQF